MGEYSCINMQSTVDFEMCLRSLCCCRKHPLHFSAFLQVVWCLVPEFSGVYSSVYQWNVPCATGRDKSIINPLLCFTIGEELFLWNFSIILFPLSIPWCIVAQKFSLSFNSPWFPKCIKLCLDLHLQTSDAEFCGDNAYKVLFRWLLHEGCIYAGAVTQ